MTDPYDSEWRRCVEVVGNVSAVSPLEGLVEEEVELEGSLAPP